MNQILQNTDFALLMPNHVLLVRGEASPDNQISILARLHLRPTRHDLVLVQRS